MSGDPSLHFENRYIRKDGQIVNIMWSARWSEENQVRIAIAHDITRRKQAEARQAAVFHFRSCLTARTICLTCSGKPPDHRHHAPRHIVSR